MIFQCLYNCYVNLSIFIINIERLSQAIVKVIEKAIASYLYYLYCVLKRNLNFLKIKIEKKYGYSSVSITAKNLLSIFIIIKFSKIMIDSTIISCVAVNNEFNIIGINRKDINVQDTHINEIQEDKEDREDDIREGY